ncbi:MAG TPA: cytochrome P450 [Pyrinomonadaceae bacterium]|nr:cytochrome P450 [Pyrinomonadaceae bacterium]
MTSPTHASLMMSDIGRVVDKLQKLRDRLAAGEQALVDDFLRAAGVVETKPSQYNPYLPNVHANPYPHYHRLQHENPVHWSDAMQAWVISRHADILEAFRERRLSYRTGFETIMVCVPKEEHESIRNVSRLLGSLLNEVDPPVHTRLRKIMVKALNATPDPQRSSHIEAIANKLLDTVQATGRMDIVKDFADPLPAIVGADILGIPDTDRKRFGQWIHDVVHTFSEGFNGNAAMLRGEAAIIELTEYMNRLFAERRAQPGHDALSAMLMDEEATDEERVLIAINIIMGMHENVTHAISLSMRTVLRDPELLCQLRDSAEVLSMAVEEMLRYEGTAPILSRVALDNIEIGGVRIPKGQRVILLVAAANRDAEAFDDPDRFMPDRRPNCHVAFGVGRRACPGSALARTIIRASVKALLTRLADLQVVDTEPLWREEINIRGLGALPVTFRPSGDLAPPAES